VAERSSLLWLVYCRSLCSTGPQVAAAAATDQKRRRSLVFINLSIENVFLRKLSKKK
jgi:hypothetical protein